MTIDFHTHIWPDSLAPRAIEALTKNIDAIFSPVTNGTCADLFKKMNDWNIDYSVIQPVITKPSQFKTTNDFAHSINTSSEWNHRLISFGALWPFSNTYKEDINYIASLNLPGIKFHPEYQQFNIDSKEMLKIYEYALSKNLMLLFHAGSDPAFSSPWHSSPKQFARIADEMKGGVIIAAHLGGIDQTDDVEKYLAGKNIFLDTSIGFTRYSHEQFLRIAEKHGYEKLLFASDSPWSNAKEELSILESLPIEEFNKKLIKGENALKLLLSNNAVQSV